MAIITTKNFSNPPSVRGIDYAGQPIPDGGYYNGRPEHQSPDREGRQDALRNAVKPPPTRRKRKRGVMSPEMRQAFAQRMRDYWAKKRGLPSVAKEETPASVDYQSVGPMPTSPSVWPDGTKDG